MLHIQLVHLFTLQLFLSGVLTTDTPRVFGGAKLKTETDKYLVAIKIKLNLNGEKVTKTCSGAILNNHWIISAAHCFRSDIDEIKVERIVKDKFEIVSHVSPSDVRLHPKYRKDEGVNAAQRDVALIKTNELRGDVEFVELSEDIPKVGQVATIAGYGETELTPKAREGKVIIQRKRKIICSIGKTWGGHGDSGGPLVSENHLIGIISRRKCSEVKCVTYYADIRSNMKWIKSVTNV